MAVIFFQNAVLHIWRLILGRWLLFKYCLLWLNYIFRDLALFLVLYLFNFKVFFNRFVWHLNFFSFLIWGIWYGLRRQLSKLNLRWSKHWGCTSWEPRTDHWASDRTRGSHTWLWSRSTWHRSRHWWPWPWHVLGLIYWRYGRRLSLHIIISNYGLCICSPLSQVTTCQFISWTL